MWSVLHQTLTLLAGSEGPWPDATHQVLLGGARNTLICVCYLQGNLPYTSDLGTIKLHRCNIEKKEDSLAHYTSRNVANLVNFWHHRDRQFNFSPFLQGGNCCRYLNSEFVSYTEFTFCS